MAGMKAFAQLALYVWALVCVLFSLWMVLAAFYLLLIGRPGFSHRKILTIAAIEVSASIGSYLVARRAYRRGNSLKALG
jgi:multisubunit Na+/H+ antiporter MnhG subunit